MSRNTHVTLCRPLECHMLFEQPKTYSDVNSFNVLLKALTREDPKRTKKTVKSAVLFWIEEGYFEYGNFKFENGNFEKQSGELKAKIT